MREQLLSRCEKEFVNKALAENVRLDGRQLLESRDVNLYFGSDWGCCVASLGQTKVLANVSCDIRPPKLSRSNEGMIYINVILNPLAAPHFEAGRQSEAEVLITRQLEKCFKDSKCIDLEALCIVADKKVWNIRVDVNVINHDGNLVDCASIATLAALSHFHRPDVTSTGDEIIIHSFTEKDPLPLTLFHQPVCVSFTTFDNGKTVIDPTYMEERLGVTQLTLGLNAYREICCLHFDHTARSGIASDVVSSVMDTASNYAINLVKKIRETVHRDVKTRYNKEAAELCRLSDMISSDKLTSMMSQRIHIRLSQWNKDKKIQVDDHDKDIEIEMKDATVENSKVIRIGEGSAELITKLQRIDVGEGGPNTWDVSDSSDDDEDPVKVIKITKIEKKVLDDIVVSDSEEEATETLSNMDLL